MFAFPCFCCLVVKSCLTLTPWTVALQAPLLMGFPRQEHWSGCHFFLQGIFPTQGLNLSLLRWQADFLPLSHLEAPLSCLLEFNIYFGVNCLLAHYSVRSFVLVLLTFQLHDIVKIPILCQLYAVHMHFFSL